MRLKGTTLAVGVMILIWGGALSWALEPKPVERVKDEGQFLSKDTRFLLEDYFETVARTLKFEAYLVVLQKETFPEAARLSDEWQRAWVTGVDGGVFAFSVKDRQLVYTPTDETMELVGKSNLIEIFKEVTELPPKSADLDVALPLQRIVSAVAKARLAKDREIAEDAAPQISRWKLVSAITGMAAGVGLLGWIFFALALIGRKRGSRVGGVPAPGMAYRNPSRKSRSRRRNESSEGEANDRY